MPRDREAEPWLAQVRPAEGQAAPDDLATSHLRLAVALAGRYRGRGVAYADLIGEANLALVEAARRYATSESKGRGVPFAYYAAVAIHWRLRRAIREAEPVHINQNAWQDMRRCSYAELTHQGDRAIAEELGLPVEKVRRLRALSYAIRGVKRFDQPVDGVEDEDVTVADLVPDPTQDVEAEVLDEAERHRLRQELSRIIEDLPRGARVAVSFRFCLPVASLETLPLVDVLKMAVREDVGVYNGLRRLRKAVGDGEKLAGRTLVSKDREVAVSAPYSPLRFGRAARVRRDQDEWCRLASEQLPPAVGSGQY